MKQSREVESVYVENVQVGTRRRRVNPEAVEALAKSMSALGLLTPITIRYVDNVTAADGQEWENAAFLITGLHRLEAARKLGWEKIDAIEATVDDIEAAMIEIAENLHRSDLSALERSEQAAEWLRLAKEKAVQVGQVSEKGGRGVRGGVSDAARGIGITRAESIRAEKVAALSPEAKQAAVAFDLDDNQSALLEAARADTASDQVARLAEIRKRKDARRAGARKEAVEVAAVEAVEVDAASEIAAWLAKRMDRAELPMVITWLEATTPKNLIRALRREFDGPMAPRSPIRDTLGRHLPQRPVAEVMNNALDQLENTADLFAEMMAWPEAEGHADTASWIERAERVLTTLTRITGGGA